MPEEDPNPSVIPVHDYGSADPDPHEIFFEIRNTGKLNATDNSSDLDPS
jgi:hypothetical protein